MNLSLDWEWKGKRLKEFLKLKAGVLESERLEH